MVIIPSRRMMPVWMRIVNIMRIPAIVNPVRTMIPECNMNAGLVIPIIYRIIIKINRMRPGNIMIMIYNLWFFLIIIDFFFINLIFFIVVFIMSGQTKLRITT